MLLPKEKLAGLNPDFRETLTRMASKLPFSLYITEAVPESKEGSHVKDSAHFRGLAVDLRAQNGWERYSIVKQALEAKIERIGVYDKHIHIDVDPSLPHPVIWQGKSN